MIKEYNGSKFNIKMTKRGYSIHYYSVELLEGNWPEDTDLITLCDNGDPKHPCHFGGHVNKNGNWASVDVYVD